MIGKSGVMRCIVDWYKKYPWLDSKASKEFIGDLKIILRDNRKYKHQATWSYKYQCYEKKAAIKAEEEKELVERLMTLWLNAKQESDKLIKEYREEKKNEIHLAQ